MRGLHEDLVRGRTLFARVLHCFPHVLLGLVIASSNAHAAVVSVGGYYTAKDGFRHATVQTSDDALHELFFNESGIFTSDLGCFGQVVATSSFYAADDDTEHVIVASKTGDIREIYFSSRNGVHQTPPIINLPGVISVGAFYDETTKNRVAIVATTGGQLIALTYNSAKPVQQTQLGSFPGAVAASGFYSEDDKLDHAIIATNSGAISEVFFSNAIGVHVTQPFLVTIPNIVSVSGFYTPDDKLRHVIVATGDGAVHELFYGPKIGAHLSEPALASFSGVVSVAGYYTPADHMRRVIVGLAGGAVHEFSYNPNKPGGDMMLGQLVSGPHIEDISPDQANAVGALDANRGFAGLTTGLAGDASALYAVSLDAGVWKSSNGSPWLRLSGSPRYAAAMAVDLNQPAHLAVGGREGDALDKSLNRSGVWESTDAGASWTYTLDPIARFGCGSQAISGVAFSRASTLFAATTCGVAVKAAGGTTFVLNPQTTALGAITAVTTSPSKVWARTASQLLLSQNDGTSWSVKTPQSSIGGLAITNPDTGDLFSLAAFDGAAYMACCTDPTPPCGNLNHLLIYSAVHDTFTLQPTVFHTTNAGTKQPELDCSGTNLGGSRFTRAVSVGGVDHLFYSASEQIYEATAFDTNGAGLGWTEAVGAICGDCTKPDPVHTDMWDFHLSPDGATEWLAGDGGVYRRSLVPSGSWAAFNAGLHTHHAQTLTFMRGGTAVRLAYPTADNDGWYWDGYLGAKGWRFYTDLGDANWTAGDGGVAGVVLIARTAPDAALVTFGDTLPNGQTTQHVSLNIDGPWDGDGFFNFIQTLDQETPAALRLDATMLASLPLRVIDPTTQTPTPVPGPLGQAPTQGIGNPVILRNPNFVASADSQATKYSGWSILADNLPAGVQHVWTSGGHLHPILYVLALQNGAAKLFKSAGFERRGPTLWRELNVQGSLQAPRPFPPSGIVIGRNGVCFNDRRFDFCRSVFVDPYDPDRLYVLTSGGVRVSVDGGQTFNADTVLTEAVTGFGAFPIESDFNGGDGNNTRIASHADPLPTLSDMGFCRSNPKIAVAASAFGGLFFKDETESWRDLSGLLPRPLSSVSSARIDCEAIYAATEGGGVFRITGYRAAPLVIAPRLKPPTF